MTIRSDHEMKSMQEAGRIVRLADGQLQPMPVAPDTMVRTKRSWLGMSIRSIVAPPEMKCAKPRAIEMPRRFSSGRRSV